MRGRGRSCAHARSASDKFIDKVMTILRRDFSRILRHFCTPSTRTLSAVFLGALDGQDAGSLTPWCSVTCIVAMSLWPFTSRLVSRVRNNNPTNQPNPTQPNPPNPTQPNPTQPNPTQPNPTQPNPTQPNPTQPNPTQPTQPNPTNQPTNQPQPTTTNKTTTINNDQQQHHQCNRCFGC